MKDVLNEVLGELRSIWPVAAETAVGASSRADAAGRGILHPARHGPMRPAQQTPIAGLYLAGDWTATGWPATMEAQQGVAIWQSRQFSPRRTPRYSQLADLKKSWLMRQIVRVP